MRIMGLAAAALLWAGSGVAAAQPARPQPPERPAASPTAADCERRESRARLLADPEGFLERAGAYGRALNLYSERLLEWRMDRLVRAGAWTEADKRAFGERLLADREFAAEAAAGMAMTMEVLEPMTRFADRRRPAAERCRDLIVTQEVFDRITASVERQWARVDALFAAEAQRLGVPLD